MPYPGGGTEGAAAYPKIYGKFENAFNIQGRILFKPLYEKVSASALPPNFGYANVRRMYTDVNTIRNYLAAKRRFLTCFYACNTNYCSVCNISNVNIKSSTDVIPIIQYVYNIVVYKTHKLNYVIAICVDNYITRNTCNHAVIISIKYVIVYAVK